MVIQSDAVNRFSLLSNGDTEPYDLQKREKTAVIIFFPAVSFLK